jgi:hypothetical protein
LNRDFYKIAGIFRIVLNNRAFFIKILIRTMFMKTLPIELPPELSAMEAKLASFRPLADPMAQERTKTVVLLESCELVRDGQLTLSREKLVETIVKSGEPEITLSLQQYTKTVRAHATFHGVLIGTILGAVIGIIGTILLVRLLLPTVTQPTVPVIEHHYYEVSGFGFQTPGKNENP